MSIVGNIKICHLAIKSSFKLPFVLLYKTKIFHLDYDLNIQLNLFKLFFRKRMTNQIS